VLSTGANSSAGPSVGSLVDRQTKSAETPYVVLFQAVAHLAASGGRGNWEAVQHTWTFEHGPVENTPTVRDASGEPRPLSCATTTADTPSGLPITNLHNIRSSTHTFHIPHAGVCHGLAGYFEAHLYGDVHCSIHPDPARGSPDMLSWFPIFFPFRVRCVQLAAIASS
jgi:protein arginine N-methyltransferase 5